MVNKKVEGDTGGGLVSVVSETVSQNTYEVFLTKSIESIDLYLPLVETLSGAKEGDLINVYLGNSGGSLSTCIYLVNLFKYSPATVSMHVLSPCYSAGAMIALAGDSITMYPNTFLMFHNYSAASGGKGKEMITSVEESESHIRTFYEDLLTPFLTKREIKLLAKDQDVYIHFNDTTLPTRIKRHFTVESMILGVLPSEQQK